MPFFRIFLIVILLFSPCAAQTAEQLIEQALAAGKTSDYGEAGKLLTQAAVLYGEAGQPLEQAQLYHYAANAYLKLESAEAVGQAAELLAKAANLYEQNSKPGEAAKERLEQTNLLVLLKRFDEALTAINRAMSLIKSQDNPDRELLYMCTRRLATVLDSSHRWAEALTVYGDLLELAREVEPEKVPEYQITMASMCQLLGEDVAAVGHYLSGIAGHEELGQTSEKQDAQKRMASFFMQRRRFEEALPLYESLVQELGDTEHGIDARFRMALAYEGLGQPERAYDILTTGRAKLTDVAYRRNVDRYRVKLLWAAGRTKEAKTLLSSDAFENDYQRADTAADFERRDLASEYFLSHIEALPQEEKPRALNQFAYRLLTWGKAAEAEKNLRAGLKLLGPKRDKTWASLTSNLGESFLKRGDPESALRHFDEALPWYEKNGSPESHATLLNNAAACHSSLGNLSKSVSYLERAVQVVDRFSKPKPVQATIQNALGYSYVQLGRYEDGIAFYRKALARHQASGNAEGERKVTFNLGAALTLNGLRDDGIGYLTDALDLSIEAEDTELQSLIFSFLAENTRDKENRRVLLTRAEELIPKLENKVVKAFFLNQKSASLADSGDWRGSKELALESLSLFPKDSPIEQASASRRLLLRSSLGLANLNEARGWSKPLLNDIEIRLWGLSSREARSFMDSRTHSLSDFCTALLEDRSVAEAFALQEKLRSLGLAALTRDVKFDESRVSSRLLEERETLAKMIATNRTSGKTQDSLISRYRIVLDQIEREYAMAGLVSKVSTVEMAQVQEALGSDEALLEFVTDEQNVYLILVTKGGAKSYELGSHRNISKKAKAAFRSVSKYHTVRTINRHLKAVGDIVLNPVLADIQNVKKLVIVPSNGLYGLPFAALPVGDDSLIDHYELTVTNSASSWLASRSMAASGSGTLVAALGDFQGASGNLVPLPQTAPEARAVVRFFPNSKLFLGENMKSTPLEKEARGKENLHLATHGFTDDREPLLSGLAFSDRRVTAADIFGWNLSAELAVLSACESSGFTERNRFLGLTSAFQYAGVRTLVVSLWSVSDEATEFWMRAFYEDLANGGTPSQAMRAAHLKTKGKWPNPFFWAPFTTWGDGLRDAS